MRAETFYVRKSGHIHQREREENRAEDTCAVGDMAEFLCCSVPFPISYAIFKSLSPTPAFQWDTHTFILPCRREWAYLRAPPPFFLFLCLIFYKNILNVSDFIISGLLVPASIQPTCTSLMPPLFADFPGRQGSLSASWGFEEVNGGPEPLSPPSALLPFSSSSFRLPSSN